MSLLNQVQDDVKTAMKAGERERVHALRMIADALQKAEKDNGGDPVEILQRERKRRLEAAEAYRDGGRTDAADAEQREADLIASYLPEQLSDEDLRAIVGDAVAESGASSPHEMGKVMAVVMPKVKGRADGKRVSAAVKEMLGVPLTPLRLTWLPATDWQSGTLVAEVESLDVAPPRFRWHDPTDSIEVLEPEPVRSVARRWIDRRGHEGNPLEPPWARAGWFARASACGVLLEGLNRINGHWQITTFDHHGIHRNRGNVIRNHVASGVRQKYRMRILSVREAA